MRVSGIYMCLPLLFFKKRSIHAYYHQCILYGIGPSTLYFWLYGGVMHSIFLALAFHNRVLRYTCAMRGYPYNELLLS